MKAFRIHHPSQIVWTAYVVASILAWAALARAQTVTWEDVPFPSDSNWPGPYGSPAIITGGGSQIILNAQPVRTVQTFTPSLSLSFDTFLTAKNASDGYLQLFYMPTGIASNLSPNPSIVLLIQYNNLDSSQNLLLLQQINGGSTTTLWSSPFSVIAGATNHVAMTVGAGGALGLSINGQPYALPSSASVPFAQFQMQLEGWQPGNTWDVLNFTAVPEPSPLLYVGMGLAGLMVSARRQRRH